MNIYIDFDDCLCETARYITGLAKELFGKTVPYEQIRTFELQHSFSLTEEQFRQLMTTAHAPGELLSYEETPGAVQTVNSWIDEGCTVSIITGRPCSAYEPSREWLDRHGLDRARLYCLNKYGREGFPTNSSFALETGDYCKMHFDYAIEDSPAAFRFFSHLPEGKVMVYDRPWNWGCDFPGTNYHRCKDWEAIKRLVQR